MKICVTGGREYNNKDEVFAYLDYIHKYRFCITSLIHGACQDRKGNLRGADKWADEWATARMIPCTQFPADWNNMGNSAGPYRNRVMIGTKPDFVVAFPGGSGTEDCVKAACDKGVPVMRWTPNWRDYAEKEEGRKSGRKAGSQKAEA